MNVRDGKRFPSRGAAQSAIVTAEATWTRPVYHRSNRHPYPQATDEQIGVQKLAEPYEMEDGTWVVVDADHPSLQGESIDIDLRKRPADMPAQAQSGKSR